MVLAPRIQTQQRLLQLHPEQPLLSLRVTALRPSTAIWVSLAVAAEPVLGVWSMSLPAETGAAVSTVLRGGHGRPDGLWDGSNEALEMARWLATRLQRPCYVTIGLDKQYGSSDAADCAAMRATVWAAALEMCEAEEKAD